MPTNCGIPLINNIKIKNMKNKILMTISFLAAVLLVTSCLKDDIGENWTDDLKGKMYAEVWNGGIASFSLQPVAAPDTFKFMVNLATDALPTEDITLTIAVNDDARVKYNSIKGTAYKLYPYIQILNPTVVIEKGTRNAYVHVKVWNANLLSACDSYMAPISIMTATGGVIVADAASTGSRLMNLPIANKYQGEYHSVGYFLHPTAPRAIDMDKTLATLTCKSVTGDHSDLGPDYTYDILVNEATTIVVGGKNVNPVTITQYGPSGGKEQLDIATDLITNEPNKRFNYWDESTKTFVLHYRYNNGGAWREIQETLTKK
jgi:hypothetical protein